MTSSEDKIKAFLSASAKGSYELAALALSSVEAHRKTLGVDAKLLKLTILFMCGSIIWELLDTELKKMLDEF